MNQSTCLLYNSDKLIEQEQPQSLTMCPQHTVCMLPQTIDQCLSGIFLEHIVCRCYCYWHPMHQSTCLLYNSDKLIEQQPQQSLTMCPQHSLYIPPYLPPVTAMSPPHMRCTR